MDDLGLQESENLACSAMWLDFAWGGSSNKILFFARDWSSNFCKAVTWETDYSAMARDGYKKCVCETFNLMEEV